MAAQGDTELTPALPPDPFAERLGLRCRITGDGRSVTTLDCGPEHCNLFGVVHGAVLFAMADIGMGITLAPALQSGCKVASVSVNASYLTAAAPGRIIVESWIVRRGRRLASLQSEARDAKGARCALFTGHFYMAPCKEDEDP